MSGARLRRALRGRPRLVLGVLLALVVQALSAGGPIGHRHAGGEARHTHAGRIAANPAPRVGHGDTGELALARAQADGWHEHAPHATLAAAAVGPSTLACHLAAEPLARGPGRVPVSADGRAPQARGPPSRLA